MMNDDVDGNGWSGEAWASEKTRNQKGVAEEK